MPGRSHWHLLERAVLNVLALGDLTNPLVSWLKYNLIYQQKRFFCDLPLFFGIFYCHK